MLDLLYAQAVGARRRWYERHPDARHRLQRPVISIGNLSVGGTGKTPLVASVVEWLLARGERPAILSRGYGRRIRDVGRRRRIRRRRRSSPISTQPATSR